MKGSGAGARPAGAVVLSLQGLAKSFGEREVVARIDLEVRAGEVFGLLGPNGAGKTTTLRMLCGLLEPDAGRAIVAGHDVATDPLAAKRAIGHVPDGAPLYAQLSPRQHLALVGRLFGLDEDAIAAGTQRLLGGFDLLDRADDPVASFSRGMRQKTALACALLPRPALLVLDEPLTGLDAPSTATVKEVLRAWADRGGAVIYTSHLLDVVERVCDRMAVLDQGRIVAEGALDDLRARAGRDGTLEQVFAALTRADDPRAAAARLLG